MSAQLTHANQNDLFDAIEPLFVEHFKSIHGSSPSLAELKHHLVTTSIDRLIDNIYSFNSRITELYTHSEIVGSINPHIRKLK